MKPVIRMPGTNSGSWLSARGCPSAVAPMANPAIRSATASTRARHPPYRARKVSPTKITPPAVWEPTPQTAMPEATAVTRSGTGPGRPRR